MKSSFNLEQGTGKLFSNSAHPIHPRATSKPSSSSHSTEKGRAFIVVWAKMKIELTSTKQKNSYSILKTAVHSPIRNIWLLWVFPYGTKFWGKEQLKTTHHNFQTFSQLTILSPHHQPPQNYNHTKVSTSCILQKKNKPHFRVQTWADEENQDMWTVATCYGKWTWIGHILAYFCMKRLKILFVFCILGCFYLK